MIKRLGLPASLALGFMALGFIMIGVAWNGAASKDCVQCQLPYILSGGIAGLGLIGLGAALLLFEAGRRMLTRLEKRLEALTEAVAVGGRAEQPASAEPTDQARKRTRSASTNGMVVLGRSSFHRPDCRLVVGKDDMDTGSAEDAEARGLYPCRVCEPTTVTPTRR